MGPRSGRPPRRIVPPAMPVTAPSPSAPSYTPPKYADPTKPDRKRVVLRSALVITLATSAIGAILVWVTPREPAIPQASEARSSPANAQLAGGKEQARGA